jgi:hypothetical protein
MEVLLNKKAKRTSIVDGASIEDLLNASSNRYVLSNLTIFIHYDYNNKFNF